MERGYSPTRAVHTEGHTETVNVSREPWFRGSPVKLTALMQSGGQDHDWQLHGGVLDM